MTSEWRSVEIGEIAKLRSGFAFKSADWKEAGVPVLKIANIKAGRVNPDGCGYVSQQVAQQAAIWFTKPGDILISMTGYVGEVAEIRDGEKFLINQRVGRFEFHDANLVDSKFFFYHLQLPKTRAEIEGVSHGSAQPNLSASDAHKIQITLPPVHDQRKISGLLGAIDDRIALLRETNKTLEAIAQAIFKSWFIDFDPVRAKMEGRIPVGLDEETAALFPDEFVASELGLVPKGWMIVKFEDFINRLSVGKKYDQKTSRAQGMVPVLDQGRSGVIGYHNDAPGVIASLDDPVVVFANHTCYMRLINFPFSAIQNVLPFKGKMVDTVWAYFATKDKQKFEEYKGHWPDFAIQKTSLPDARLTYAFRNLVDPLMRKIRANELQVETLSAIRDALLPRLISEKLRISDDELVTQT